MNNQNNANVMFNNIIIRINSNKFTTDLLEIRQNLEIAYHELRNIVLLDPIEIPSHRILGLANLLVNRYKYTQLRITIKSLNMYYLADEKMLTDMIWDMHCELRGCYDMYKIRLIDIGIQTIEHLNAHQWVGWDIQTKEMLISFVDAVYVEQQTNIPIDTLIQSINYNSYISFINILINNIDKLDGIPIFLVELKQLKRSLFISFNNLKDDHIEINKIININYLFGTYSNFIDSTFLDVDNATIMEEMEEMYNYEINLKKM